MSNTIFLVVKKELTDIFRDKRTLIMSILIPLLLFPILSMVIGRSINSANKSVEENLKIAVVDKGNSSLQKFLKEQKNINVVSTSAPEEDVKEGRIFVAVIIAPDFDAAIEKGDTAPVTLVYDNSSQQSGLAMSKINVLIGNYSKGIVTERLAAKNIDVKILSPIEIKEQTSQKEGDGTAKMILSMMLPLLLIVYCVTGPLPAATDLGAGEKERGTLEPLLTTRANRMSLLWGKFLAITVMGLITSVASLAGMYIAMSQKNGMFTSGSPQGTTGSISLEPQALIVIGVVVVLTTMVFGALELSISIYARSFKEAQTYLSPLTIIAIIPIYATYMLDAKNISTAYFNIPLANEVCVLKEVISGIYNPVHILITVAWTAAYIAASIVFARYMFNRERVVFRT
ncbi:MAG: ABC transporter permease [Bacillota bacterium]|nr:ABC transporter permease [Bacillota bacterium]